MKELAQNLTWLHLYLRFVDFEFDAHATTVPQHSMMVVHNGLYCFHYFPCRGAVRVWKPKVTPMSDLRPGELPRGPEGEVYVQKTSLAANHSDSVSPTQPPFI